VNNYMLVAVLSGFVLAGLAPLVTMIGRKATGWILALLPLGLFIYFGSFIGPVSAGAVIAEARPWVPTLGISLSFYLDGLSLIFALIITGIGSLVIIYGGGYLAGDRQISRFYVYILMFMASMLGVVLADNVITLFVFWELTSVSSFLLIGYYHEQADSRAAALQALLVTGAGGLALLAGLTIMALVGGSWEISELLNRGEILANSALYPAILGLVLAGAFTKSAQFPFHFWLPNAMAAPAPVSTYLHSATMVKAGIYLLARLSPALGNTGAWLYLVTGFGVVTMLLGAYIAWQQTDLKRILAYSTVSALGLLTMLLGLGDEHAIEAAIVFLVVHSLYKGSLFMVAGTVDHETGMRFIDRLGGLRRLMPITATAAVLAALSMSGVPLFLGFIGKELIYEATLEGEVAWQVLTASAVLANILTIVAAGLVTVRPFFGKLAPTPKPPHEAPVSMWLGPIILAGLGLLLGLISIEAIALNIDKALVSPAVSAVLAEPTVVSLHLFPDELSLVLLLSAITIAGGIGVYLVRDRLYRAVQPLSMVTRWGPERWYAWTLDGMMILARYQTRLLQSGYLRYYLMTVILTTVIMAGYTLVTQTTLDVNAFWRQRDNTRRHGDDRSVAVAAGSRSGPGCCRIWYRAAIHSF
jgi:multicomponent Na+:H+ antiporter subunit A